MRKAFAVGVVLGAFVAWASDLRLGAVVQGRNIQTFTGKPGGKYTIQCPNIDGGAGQAIYLRPGCPLKSDGGVLCVLDAGQGDLIVDFTVAANMKGGFPVDLAVNEDRFYIANVGGYGSDVYCPVFRRNP